MSARRGAAVAALVLAAAAPAGAAHAAGAGDKIAFGTSAGITVVAGDLAAAPQVVLPRGEWPSWSPDGTRLAFTRMSPPDGLGIAGADGSSPAVLTTTPVATTEAEAQAPGFFGDLMPSWSPDGTHLAFLRATLRGSDVWTVAADGSGARRLVAAAGPDHADTDPHYLADGSRIRFEGGGDLWDVRPDGSRLRRVAAVGRLDAVSAPDGSAYALTQPGGPVYMVDYVGGGLRAVAGAGRMPIAFSRNGARLLVGTLNDAKARGAVIDLAGHRPPQPVAATEQGLAGAAFGAPAWWTPAPRQPFRAADDREAPESVLSDAHGRLVALRRDRPRTVTANQIDTTLATVDQTGIRAISVAWVQGRERPRWQDVTKSGAFEGTLHRGPGTYRLLVRATDVLGHTTKRPSEVIVKLTP
ncbi:MAG TPA: hypothetical protein VK501_16120 [Baekduia sp.]|uniref:TolB family protein n=1 Tax=Baekduia sp. TaxID=2600305 RepID=UPI002C5B35D4|nr:hypothetical protein [Baekduia sp.]HMJ35435.1 hypothetical protein [Baekduia sp.]